MGITIAARWLISADQLVEYPLVTVEHGYVTTCESLSPAEHARASATHRFPQAALVPAYLDVHIHGAAGHDVMEATPEALHTIGSFLALRGVGAYLPTTVTSTHEQTLRALQGLAREIERPAIGTYGAVPLGIHLEGPFLSHLKRGVHTESLLHAPSIELFDQFWQAAEGRILLMTVAPELPGAAELIAHAAALGVRSSLGHSNATAAEAEAGFLAGARSATHMFNAMRALDHRDPGIAGYILDQDNLYAELICDGVHVDPLMVRLCLKAKGGDRILLVTDGISATGMPDGEYKLGELEVTVRDGRCTSGGVLAGSVLTLDRAVENFVEFTGASLRTATCAASLNPARMLGIADQWGEIAPGRPADITVLSDSAEVLQTFLCGQPVMQ